MPAKKADIWDKLTRHHKANHPDWGAGRILAALQQDGIARKRSDCPVERWVGKWLTTNWPMAEDEIRRYRRFSWPQSMQDGIVSWDAGPSAFELMRESSHILGMLWAGPSNRVINCFWRVTQLAESAPFDIRLCLSAVLLVAESQGNTEWLSALQWYFTLQPWLSAENDAAWREAVAAGTAPGVPSGAIYHNAAILEAEDKEFLEVVNQLCREDVVIQPRPDSFIEARLSARSLGIVQYQEVTL